MIQGFVFDSAVNHGPEQALLFVQRSCNLLGAKPALNEDGVMGPHTRRAAEAAVQRFSSRLMRTLLAERRNFYFKLIEARPAQQVLLKSWLNQLAEFDSSDTWIV
jgi:lysozyme family protein